MNLVDTEKAELRRRELLRSVRFEAMAERIMAENRRMMALREELLAQRLREKRAPQLEFCI